MRNLKRTVIVALFCLGIAAAPNIDARECNLYDVVVDLMREARTRQSRKTHWRADGDWKAWEAQVQKELEANGLLSKDANAHAKSFRRSLQREQKTTPTSATSQELRNGRRKRPTEFPMERRALRSLQQLKKSNKGIYDSYQKWEALVRRYGLEEVRRIAGYHDEPLSGARTGQRSVRLNQQYRIIYTLDSQKQIRILDVTPHDYRVK